MFFLFHLFSQREPFLYLYRFIYLYLVPPKVSYGQYLLTSLLLSTSILCQLRYPTLFHSPICYVLPYRPIRYCWQPLFGMFLTLYCHFNVLTYIFVISGHVPSSALSTVLLVVYMSTLVFFWLLSSVLLPTVLRTSCSLPIFLRHILTLVQSH